MPARCRFFTLALRLSRSKFRIQISEYGKTEPEGRQRTSRIVTAVSMLVCHSRHDPTALIPQCQNRPQHATLIADVLLWARQAASQSAKTHRTHYTQTLILCALHPALLARPASWTFQLRTRSDRVRVAGGRAVLQLLLCCWPSGARGHLLWLLLLLELLVVLLAVLLLLLLVVAVQQ